MSPAEPAVTNGGIDVLTPSLASDMSSLSLDPTGYSGGASYNASTVSFSYASIKISIDVTRDGK